MGGAGMHRRDEESGHWADMRVPVCESESTTPEPPEPEPRPSSVQQMVMGTIDGLGESDIQGVRLYGPQEENLFEDTLHLLAMIEKATDDLQPRWDLVLQLPVSKKSKITKQQEMLLQTLEESPLIVDVSTSILDGTTLVKLAARRKVLQRMATELKLRIPVGALIFVPCAVCKKKDCGPYLYKASKLVQAPFDPEQMVKVEHNLCPECFDAGRFPEDTAREEFQPEGDPTGKTRYCHVMHQPYHPKLDSDPSILSMPEDDVLFFRSSLRLRIIRAILTLRRGRGGCNLDIEELEADGVISKVVPLHEEGWHVSMHVGIETASPIDWLMEHCVHTWRKPPWEIPLDAMAQYFGAKVGIYFGWVTFYTVFLAPLAAVGFAVAISGYAGASVALDPFFAAVTCVWTTLYARFWARRRSALVQEWGMDGFAEREPPRARFEGEMRTVDLKSNTFTLPLTIGPDGREKWYPSWRRNCKKYLVTYPLVLAVLFACVMSMIGVLALRSFMLNQKGAGGAPKWGKTTVGTVTGVASAVSIIIFDALYSWVSQRLNEWENYRTDSQHENSLIIKTFCFQFINNYGTLFFLAYLPSFSVGAVSVVAEEMFQLSPGVDPGVLRQHRMDALHQQLLIILVVKQVQRNLMSIIVPWIKGKLASVVRKRRVADGADPRQPHPEEVQATLPVYDGVFYEYSEMCIQFGYITLFAAAFPLGPMCALVNNWIEIRLDAHKMMKRTTRPYPRGAENIGSWKDVLLIMSFLAVLNNCAIVSFTSNDIAKHWSINTNLGRLAFFVLSDHALFLMIVAARLLIPDVPFEVLARRAKDDVLENDYDAWQDPDAPLVGTSSHSLNPGSRRSMDLRPVTPPRISVDVDDEGVGGSQEHEEATRKKSA